MQREQQAILSHAALQSMAWTPEQRVKLGVDTLELVDLLDPNFPSLEFESEEDLIAVISTWPDRKIGLVYDLSWRYLGFIADDIVPAAGYFTGLERNPVQWGIKAIEAYARQVGPEKSRWFKSANLQRAL
jgi:hypothetical protein